MTLLKFYHLYCTCCGREYKNEVFESPEEAEEIATNNGWKWIKVENGSIWQYCPKCLEQNRHISDE
jgi:hypothetical protein